MGRIRRKLDALLGRKFETSKFKATVNLAVARLSILKNQRQARLTLARSDIIELLKLNHHEHALNRVDQVIKEQNMLDMFVMMDGYCHLLSQMANLIEQEKNCPDELKEAAASLLYAAPRCGEFPELQEIRAILTARYGKEFANSAIELRSNCGVNTRMIQKLSQRQSVLESRMKVLQEIATENGIDLQLDDLSPVIKEDQPEVESVSTHSGIENTSSVLRDEFDEVLSFTESRKGKKKYRDVEDAAQAAFESAAYAAAAARAAVELSRSRSFGSDNPDSPNSRPRKALNSKPDKSNLQMRYEKRHELESESEFESTLNPNPELEDEITKVENEGDEIKKSTVAGETDGSDLDGYKQPLEKTIAFDESDNETEKGYTGFTSSRNHDKVITAKQMEFDSGYGEGWKTTEQEVHQLDFTKRPISVRTQRVYVR
ncbi:hypothetical protein L2E82_13868 [Cichorium intybus]|uniref:Uncharacterized protein n=1 Tax=Cichorium intybus TaxID=13427 RepID=A0ACB9EYV4_CICIN|nr:hypothetical protein L1887_33514 [Cichorium endivia]KAI3763870.1 hypothetical protein L2E82_13868 [Cichorium intybus]